MKRKILIITNHYLPGYKAGGPIKSISAICENLKYDFDITVMTLNYDFREKKKYTNILTNEINFLNGYNILYLSMIKLFNIKKWIDEIKPNIIYLNSFFSKFTLYILLLKKLGFISNNIQIILAPRGELSQGALSIKSLKKKIYINIMKVFNFYNNIIFHSTDIIETNDIKKIFLNNKIIQIKNLINLNNNNLKVKKQENNLKMVFLSRISEKKNLLYALDILKNIDEKGIIFDIYGPKEDIDYWKKCENIIKDIKNIKVSYKGSIKPMEVSEILSNYHLFFLPTKNENFGHAIVEAMQVGVIPLISDQTPWNDLQDYQAGWVVSLNEKENFIKVIYEVLNYNNEKFINISKNVKKYINNKINLQKLKNEYIEMYNSAILRNMK